MALPSLDLNYEERRDGKRNLDMRKDAFKKKYEKTKEEIVQDLSSDSYTLFPVSKTIKDYGIKRFDYEPFMYNLREDHDIVSIMEQSGKGRKRSIALKATDSESKKTLKYRGYGYPRITDEIIDILEKVFPDAIHSGQVKCSYNQILQIVSSLLHEEKVSKSQWLEINTVAISYKYLMSLESVELVMKEFQKKGLIVHSKFAITKDEAKANNIPTHIRRAFIAIDSIALNFNMPGSKAFESRLKELKREIREGKNVPDGFENVKHVDIVENYDSDKDVEVLINATINNPAMQECGKKKAKEIASHYSETQDILAERFRKIKVQKAAQKLSVIDGAKSKEATGEFDWASFQHGMEDLEDKAKKVFMEFRRADAYQKAWKDEIEQLKKENQEKDQQLQDAKKKILVYEERAKDDHELLRRRDQQTKELRTAASDLQKKLKSREKLFNDAMQDYVSNAQNEMVLLGGTLSGIFSNMMNFQKYKLNDERFMRQQQLQVMQFINASLDRIKNYQRRSTKVESEIH